MITKEYFPDRGVVVLTVENPPLPTTRHTITAQALADGRVSLESEIARLTAQAEEQLRVHEMMVNLIQQGTHS